MDDEVYYKIYYLDMKDYVTIVCMQWFDECDYVQEHFFKDTDGNVLKFNQEKDAIAWLRNNIKEDKIDPDYKNSFKYAGFNQLDFMKS